MVRPIDIAGNRFGRLVAIERIESSGHGSARWRCQCDCGRETTAFYMNLKTGRTRSCGCLKRDTIGALNRSHMMCRTPTWNSWRAMVERCTNPKNIGWRLYGGRGIEVCPRWLKFENFFADMGVRPKGKTLDRVNGALGYAPDNVRWATMKEQQRNRRNNRPLTLNGKTQTLTGWAKATGIKRQCIDRRLRRGWTIEKALTIPPR